MPVADARWLQRRDEGEDVRALQQAANVWILYQASIGVERCGEMRRPALLVEDGLFGPRTDEAVRWLQCRMGVGVDGRAGPVTLGALRKHLDNQGLGVLEYGAQQGVLPVRYTATEAANALRTAAGLPALPEAPTPERPPRRLPSWLPWVVLAAGLVAFARTLRRR